MKIYKLDNKLMLSSDGKLYVKPEAEKLIIDGLEYRTVTMPDGRVWMAENLQAAEGDAMFYDNDEATYGRNGKNYGRLYTWREAKSAAAKVEGWHVPSNEEWYALVNSLGGADEAGRKLKSTTDWSHATDEYGFTAYPAGYVNNQSKSIGAGRSSWLLSYTMEGIPLPGYALYYYFELEFEKSSFYRKQIYDNFRFSVRLIKDI